MLYIVRHGQTKMNKVFALQGRSDLPLNAEGCRQAEEAGKWFREQGITFDRVYSSPLQRTVKTAQLCAPGSTVVIDDRLIEMDYGPYEGMDLKSPAPEVLEFFRDFVHHQAPDGMEPLASVVDRLGSFLQEICAEAQAGNVLVSTHAIAMKGALEYLTPGSDGSYWSKNIGNCSIYRSIVSEDGRYSIPKEIRKGEV